MSASLCFLCYASVSNSSTGTNNKEQTTVQNAFRLYINTISHEFSSYSNYLNAHEDENNGFITLFGRCCNKTKSYLANFKYCPCHYQLNLLSNLRQYSLFRNSNHSSFHIQGAYLTLFLFFFFKFNVNFV